MVPLGNIDFASTSASIDDEIVIINNVMVVYIVLDRSSIFNGLEKEYQGSEEKYALWQLHVELA